MKISKILIILISLFYLASAQAKTFKIATTAPGGSFWMKQMRAGAKKIKQQTNDRVKFKFYPGGIMGSEAVMMKKIRIHQLQGAAVSNGILSKFYPDSQIYALPMIFNNYDEVDYVRNIMDKKIIKGLDQAGLISFGLSEGGFAYIMSTTPVKKTVDLDNHKVWSPTNNKQVELALKSFGITPIPLNLGDVLTGLQTNLIDTVAVAPIAAIALQWHTQIKNVTNLPLMYIYATLVLDKKEFNKITKDDQKIVNEVMTKIFTKIDKQNRIDNLSAFNALSSQGIKIISPESDDLKIWYEKGQVARTKVMSKGIMSDKTIKEITQLLTEFRKKKNLSAAK